MGASVAQWVRNRRLQYTRLPSYGEAMPRTFTYGSWCIAVCLINRRPSGTRKHQRCPSVSCQ